MQQSHGEITERKFLSPQEILGLQDNLRYADLKFKLMFTFLLNFGMRRAELCQLRVCDIDQDNWLLNIRGVKRSKNRVFPIPPPILPDLKLFLRSIDRLDEESLFNVPVSTLRDHWYNLRPKGCKKGIHSLRHTFAIALFRSSRDIKLVQTCLGHRNINNTMVYADYVYSREEMSLALKNGLFSEVRYEKNKRA
jgi:integrase/recombinase XerC